MANQAWPNDLPDIQYFPITITRQDARVRTKMDSGVDKVRRRYTSAREIFTLSFRFEGDEKKNFDDFYENDINEGALKFDWEHPVTRNAVEMRFIDVPKFEIQRGGSSDGTLWVSQEVRLEILP